MCIRDRGRQAHPPLGGHPGLQLRCGVHRLRRTAHRAPQHHDAHRHRAGALPRPQRHDVDDSDPRAPARLSVGRRTALRADDSASGGRLRFGRTTALRADDCASGGGLRFGRTIPTDESSRGADLLPKTSPHAPKQITRAEGDHPFRSRSHAPKETTPSEADHAPKRVSPRRPVPMWRRTQPRRTGRT